MCAVSMLSMRASAAAKTRGGAEGLDQHVGQSAVVGAFGVGSHESGVSDLAAGYEAC